MLQSSMNAGENLVDRITDTRRPRANIPCNITQANSLKTLMCSTINRVHWSFSIIASLSCATFSATLKVQVVFIYFPLMSLLVFHLVGFSFSSFADVSGCNLKDVMPCHASVPSLEDRSAARCVRSLHCLLFFPLQQ